MWDVIQFYGFCCLDCKICRYIGYLNTGHLTLETLYLQWIEWNEMKWAYISLKLNEWLLWLRNRKSDIIKTEMPTALNTL